VGFDAIERALLELVEVPAGFGDADDGNVEVVPLDESQKRGENLFEGEIACRTEENQRIRLWRGHIRIIALWRFGAGEKAPA
jgi:hypothetical protein